MANGDWQMTNVRSGQGKSGQISGSREISVDLIRSNKISADLVRSQ